MQEENNYGIAIAITLIVATLFFGGWYIFVGQIFSQPNQEIPKQNIQIEPSGLITPENNQ